LPQISNGLRDYNNLIATGRLRIGNPTSKAESYRLLDSYWQPPRGDVDQFSFDAMMWSGALIRPGNASIAAFLKKLFGTMFLSGVVYNTATQNDQFTLRDAQPNNLPVGSFLSHGGRVIIQLPVRTAYDDAGTAYFNWLTDEVRTAGRLITRSAATHALADRPDAITLFGNRKYRLTEKRGKSTGLRGFFKNFSEHNHFGVNVSLGGDGNLCPFSGNTVRADGAHGHLYIYFNPKEVGQCGGMMVGCENSAPGVTSQTFVPHDWKAISEEYSPCGTRKWAALASGPKPKAEAMFVDLSDGWSWLQGLAENFTEQELDHTPSPTLPTTRLGDAQRALIYAMRDLLASAPVNPRINRVKGALEGHLAALLATRGMTRTRITEILMECGFMLGVGNPNVRGGALANQIRVNVPTPVGRAMTACSDAWAQAV